jgi:hypothetical protein
MSYRNTVEYRETMKEIQQMIHLSFRNAVLESRKALKATEDAFAERSNALAARIDDLENQLSAAIAKLSKSDEDTVKLIAKQGEEMAALRKQLIMLGSLTPGTLTNT